MLSFARKVFKEPEADPAYYREWIANTQSVHGAVFAYVESLIIVGAFQIAALQSGSVAVWTLYGLAFFVQLLLTGTYFRVALGLLLQKFKPNGRWRNLLLWAPGLLGLAFNSWLVGVAGDVINELIKAGLASTS